MQVTKITVKLPYIGPVHVWNWIEEQTICTVEASFNDETSEWTFSPAFEEYVAEFSDFLEKLEEFYG